MAVFPMGRQPGVTGLGLGTEILNVLRGGGAKLSTSTRQSFTSTVKHRITNCGAFWIANMAAYACALSSHVELARAGAALSLITTIKKVHEDDTDQRITYFSIVCQRVPEGHCYHQTIFGQEQVDGCHCR